MKRRLISLLSVCLVALAPAAGPAVAQQAPAGDAATPTPAQPMTMPAQNVSNEQLRKFVNAAQRVSMISEEYTPKLQAAPDTSTQQRVHRAADGKMVEAVHAEGLTVDEFNGIGQAVQQDPALAQRVRDMAK